MPTFNVGPSKITENTKKDIVAATQNGVLEISHRSAQFTEISRRAVEELRVFMNIPDDYHVFFTDSATRAMELAVLGACEGQSFHYVNGNFSTLFYNVAKSLGKKAEKDEVGLGASNDFENVQIPKDADFVALTHNETSTGVVCTPEDVQTVRKKTKNAILAIDITSSVGLYDIDVKLADVLLFSVQKGPGLPAGLGVMVVSPRAIERARDIAKKGGAQTYFTFEKMLENMNETYFTVQTPNVLGIYLLGEKLKRWNECGGIERNMQERDEKWKMFDDFFKTKQEKGWKYFAQDAIRNSRSAICVQAPEDEITQYHKKLAEHGITSGKGYGSLKNSTFRVANFPAVTTDDVRAYIQALS